MAVTYEWDIETFDPETGDIEDHNFSDDLSALLPEYLPSEPTTRLVLVRHVGNELEGETDRAWAYVKNWRLPDEFEYVDGIPNGLKVPARFHRLIARVAT